MANHYDSIILGSGQAGTPLATALAKAGHRTALVESTHIGGTCINEGCTPTKTMVASARVAHLARRRHDYGVSLDTEDGARGERAAVKVDMARVRERKRDIVASFRGGSERRLAGVPGLDVLRGTGKFVGKAGGGEEGYEMEVELAAGSTAETKAITAKRVFINTGCRPVPLRIPGAEGVAVLDSTTVMELAAVPAKLAVVGGGYVGLEFAQMFRRFGAAVTIVQRAAQLLPKEDRDVADAMRAVLEQDGIEVLLNAIPVSLATATDGDGPIELQVEQKAASSATAAATTTTTTVRNISHVLAAAGRTPNTAALGLAAVGVATDARGFVQTDEFLETTAPGIFALGDVKGGPQFTHIAYDDFRVLRHNLLTTPIPAPAARQSIAGRLVPYTVFTDPQLGRTGYTEASAVRALGGSPARVRTATMPMSWVARALETDETRGLLKAVVDADSGAVLGFACVGLEGGELASVVHAAILGGLSWRTLRDAVFPHPGLAEALNNLWTGLE